MEDRNEKMISGDYLVNATGADGQLRVYAVSSRAMAEEARQIHDLSPTATAALGRLLSAGVMMGSMMKGENDILTLQIRSDGPIGGLTVTARPNGTARGYTIHPQEDVPPVRKGKLDVGGLVGKGTLSVIRDLGLKEPYTGQVNLVSGEIAQDIAYYYAVSEQVNSVVSLGVLVDPDLHVRQAGGFILQLMPFASEDVISVLEKNVASLPTSTTMLEEGCTPEDMIGRVLTGLPYQINERMPVSYHCECSHERVERAIISIGKEDLQEMIDEGKPIEVKCEFCRRTYTFTPEELKELVAR